MVHLKIKYILWLLEQLLNKTHSLASEKNDNLKILNKKIIKKQQQQIGVVDYINDGLQCFLCLWHYRPFDQEVEFLSSFLECSLAM